MNFYCREVINAPQGIQKSAQRELEVHAEDEQSFLSRLLSQLQAGRTEGVQKTGERRSVGPPGSPGVLPSAKKMDGKVGVQGGEGVLANFFNSLLAKKGPGSPSPVKVDGVGEVGRVDAAAELERLSRATAANSVRDGITENSSDC